MNLKPYWFLVSAGRRREVKVLLSFTPEGALRRACHGGQRCALIPPPVDAAEVHRQEQAVAAWMDRNPAIRANIARQEAGDFSVDNLINPF